MSDANAWLQTAVAHIHGGRAPYHVDSRHLDELGMTWDGLEGLPFALSSLVVDAQRLPADCRVALAVPLADSEDLPGTGRSSTTSCSTTVSRRRSTCSARSTSRWAPTRATTCTFRTRPHRGVARHHACRARRSTRPRSSRAAVGWTNTLWIHVLRTARS
ncbi:hypothetical protein NKG05_02240 [Oerskovia sp. M15]